MGPYMVNNFRQRMRLHVMRERHPINLKLDEFNRWVKKCPAVEIKKLGF